MQFSDISACDTIPVFSSQSKYMAYCLKDNIYIKMSQIDLKNQAVISIKGKNVKEFKNLKINFSPDESLIALTFHNNLLQIYDIYGKIKCRIQDKINMIDSIVWAPDSTQILAFSTSLGKCQIYNLSLGSISEIRRTKASNSDGCAFSKQYGNNPPLYMAILEKHDKKDSVGIYYCPDWTLTSYIPLDSFDAVKVQFANNNTLVVYQNSITFRVFFLDFFAGVREIYHPSEYSLGVKTSKTSPNQKFLALGSYDQNVHLMNLLTCKLIAKLDCSLQTINCQKTTVFKETSNQFLVINQGAQKLKAIKEKPENPLAISQIQFNYSSEYIAVKNEFYPQCVFIWNLFTLQLTDVVISASSIKDFKWIQSQDSLCIAADQNKLLFWKDSYIEEVIIPGQTFIPNQISTGCDEKVILSNRHKQKKFYLAAFD